MSDDAAVPSTTPLHASIPLLDTDVLSAPATSDARCSAMRQRDSQQFRCDEEWKARCTDAFVFRLEKEVGEESIRLTISGEISLACAELVEGYCDQALRDGKAVDLVLDVITIDEGVRALLRRLTAKGVCLIAKGLYHSYVVDTIRTTVRRDPAG